MQQLFQRSSLTLADTVEMYVLNTVRGFHLSVGKHTLKTSWVGRAYKIIPLR
jgi:hypothetical protein